MVRAETLEKIMAEYASVAALVIDEDMVLPLHCNGKQVNIDVPKNATVLIIGEEKR